MAEKKALKGFCAARIWPVTANSVNTYTTGAKIDLPGAQGLNKETTGSEYTVYADDGIYDTGIERQFDTLTFTVAELPLDIHAKLSGAEEDPDEPGTYAFTNNDTAPEYAFGYAALMLNKQYRMYKHYAIKLMRVSASHVTRGQNNDIQAYQLTFRNTQRAADGRYEAPRDSTDGTYSWLDTIDNIPATPAP